MPGEAAGLLKGDKIIKLNGEEVYSVDYFISTLQKLGETEIALEIERNKELQTINVTPKAVEGQDGQKRVMVGFRIDFEKVIVHKNPIDQVHGMMSTIIRTVSALFNINSEM